MRDVNELQLHQKQEQDTAASRLICLYLNFSEISSSDSLIANDRQTYIHWRLLSRKKTPLATPLRDEGLHCTAARGIVVNYIVNNGITDSSSTHPARKRSFVLSLFSFSSTRITRYDILQRMVVYSSYLSWQPVIVSESHLTTILFKASTKQLTMRVLAGNLKKQL